MPSKRTLEVAVEIRKIQDTPVPKNRQRRKALQRRLGKLVSYMKAQNL